MALFKAKVVISDYNKNNFWHSTSTNIKLRLEDKKRVLVTVKTADWLCFSF